MVQPQENLIAWLLREGTTPWPVVMLGQTAGEGEWTVRLLGEDGRKTVARTKDLRDYAAHLFYAFQASGKMRSAMALACSEAHSLGRSSAPSSQRTALMAPSFDSFANALTGKVRKSGSAAKRHKPNIESNVENEQAREHCFQCDTAVKEQTSAINALEQSRKNAERKLKQVREEAARLHADENHWREKEESLRYQASQAAAKLAEAQNAVERWDIEERAAANELREQDDALVAQRQELDVRIMHKQAAVAYLEKCGVDGSKEMEETQEAGTGNVSKSTPDKDVPDQKKPAPSAEYGTSSISTWDITNNEMIRQPVISSVPLTIRVLQSNSRSNLLEQGHGQYGHVVTQAQTAIVSAPTTKHNESITPVQLTRTGTSFVSGKLPSNARYIEAAEELGVRMVVYDGDVVYDLGNEGIYAAKYFKRDLKAFHRKHGFEGYAVPNSQGKEVDVYRLLKTVLSWGGIDAVRSSSRIGQLCDAVDVRRGTASILKKFYISYLFPYEQALVSGRVPPRDEIDDMLNSNKNGAINDRPETLRIESSNSMVRMSEY